MPTQSDSAAAEIPPAAYPGAARAEISNLAIASLMLSLLGAFTLLVFFVGLLPAVAAVICGHLALIKIKLAQGSLRGRAPAVLGLIVGYTTVFATPVIAVSLALGYPHLVEYLRQGSEQARVEQALELFRACEDYARDHRGSYPEDWEKLRGRYLNPSRLEYLLSRHPLTPAPFWVKKEEKSGEAESGPVYRLVPHERPILPQLEGTVVVIQEVAPAAIREIVVVYDDGNTKLIANPYSD